MARTDTPPVTRNESPAVPGPPGLTDGAATPELQVARDLVRRALPVVPVLLLVAALGWGVHGALSAGYGVALVLLNLLASAALIAWGARRSPAALMGAVLGGFAVRLGLLTLAVATVRDAAWVELTPLLSTILVTHVGLLVWETRYVSLSLAYPGLKPRVGTAPGGTEP